MKLFQPGIQLVLSLGLLVTLGSCGGGNSTAGIEGTGSPVAAYGSVTGFGSIYVNGLRFRTDTAQFTVNGEVAGEAAIQPGMVVHIDGNDADSNDPHAQTVVYDRNLLGPVNTIQNLSSETKQLTLLGQQLLIHSDIVFEGIEFSELATGNILEVSGLINDEGILVATRITSLATTEFEVEGEIRAINTNSATFKIQELVIDYNQASFIDGATDNLINGKQIEVRGTLNDDGTFQAQIIRFKSPLPVPATGTLISIEGIIENFTSVQFFQVGNFNVDASNASVERGGINQLKDDVRLAVQGKVSATGVLQADIVSLHLSNETKLSGMVESVDVQTGELRVLGTTFTSDSFTVFDDKSSKHDRFIHLAEIAVGDYVEVFGYYVDEQLIAVRIKRLDDQGTTTTISGPATRIESAALFYVMNIQVDGSSAEGNEIIAGLKPGTRVEVEGTYTGTKMMVATRIRLASSVP